MAVGLSQSPVARNQRHTETLCQGDVYAVGHSVRVAQLVGALNKRLCGPTTQRQVLEIDNCHQPFVIADQPAYDCAADSTDNLDIEVRRGMHSLAPQSLGHRCPWKRCK